MPAKKKTVQRGRASQTASKPVSKGKSNNQRSKTSQQKSSGSFLVLLYDFFAGTYFGRILVAALLLCLIMLINLLVSGDRFNCFFILTGIELTVAVVGGWLYFLLKDDGE